VPGKAGLCLVLLAGALAVGQGAVRGGAPRAERRPAPVMGVGGADWLEREGREAEQRPAEVIRTMGLADGAIVADLGCGTGFFARRMARAVGPRGRVYGVDIQPEMLDRMTRLLAQEGITNVVPVLGKADDPRLAPGSLDWILLVDVYHELQQPQPMLRKMREALKEEGRVALVEYRLEGDTAAHIRTEHRMSVEQVLSEWQPAGFRLVRRYEYLPTQHLFVFAKAR
jgi:ubiquinone/menaquinone biosynthesis C-methylase UbiE